jgi:hypothetical protein
MTVSSSVTRNDHTASNTNSVYSYTFQINEATDLTVMLDGVVQTLNTHYTVQGVGGGTRSITFTLVDQNGQPRHPNADQKIAIFMSMELDRETSYQPSGAFLAGDVNNDFDRLWLACNQQQTAINRSLRLPDKESSPLDENGNPSNMELPDVNTRKGKVLGFHETTGSPVAMQTALGDIAIADVTNLQAALNGKVDDIQVLTDVPSGAVFTDTQYTNVSEFNNDENFIKTSDTIDGGNF